eukprot:CAMPEP_0119132666 /NCGR_PEP_ID=MMETSP1310-20130426/12010_1 /TAXON_ID=464262 /ORGANISM="Genus nov. species nov., Strain RCC2339" /LENGTH=461 /DNA_ID=CAMNT_0007123309 /DNA_START=54 /DNA_END=1439 /DNA_ORIENTATION=+
MMFMRVCRPAQFRAVRSAFVATPAYYSTDSLRARLTELVPVKQEQVKRIKQEHGSKVLGEVTVDQAYGGARGVKCLITETSLLDAEEGIRLRGLTVFDCQEKLPRVDEEPLPEGLLWLLLTGEVPSDAQVRELTQNLASRAELPAYVKDLIAGFPKDLHPMTQFSMSVMALQRDSKFAKAYADGIHKSKYWEFAYEDTLDLVAKLPEVCARIYNHTYHSDRQIAFDPELDWGANLASMMGFTDPKFLDLMRLYAVIHSDHEGGNVSAHATHLVGSALSDPYLSLAAGLNGLAGPLHGLANQEVLNWLVDFKEKYAIGDDVDQGDLEKACWDTLNSGQVIPGFGHAVLRKTDPRYTCQRNFALKHLPDDPMFKLVSALYEVAPKVLTEQGKTKNPWPNVDSHSGVLLTHYGLTESNFYTVLFGASRALGVLPSLVWDRALGFPIERPKSMTSEWIEQQFANK